MLVCLFTFGAPPASADSFTFDLTVGNSALSGNPGPYGTVTVDLTTPTTATVTFDANAGGGFLFIDSSIADVNVNATSWTISGFSETNPPGFGFVAPDTVTDGGSGTVDGFGTFNQTSNNTDGFADAASQVVFTLTDTSGTWASAANVLTPNADGNTVAAHIAVCDSGAPCVQSEGATVTGFATNGPAPSVPEPSSLSMLGVGVLGLLGFARRRLLA
jgi:hypothetical protein